jgi:hypothetical protein
MVGETSGYINYREGWVSVVPATNAAWGQTPGPPRRTTGKGGPLRKDLQKLPTSTAQFHCYNCQFSVPALLDNVVERLQVSNCSR